MMAKKKSSTRTKSKEEEVEFDFESSLAQVEQIVAKLESGELGLTDSLEQYESGIKHLKRCHALLDAAQQRVSVLSGFDAEGNPVTPPLDEVEARTGRGKRAGKSQASSSTSKAKKGGDGTLSRGRGDTDSVDDSPGLF